MMHKLHQRGFSLVELSIVLVILGLLVGGVLSGQSLIRASELRSVVTQHDKFYTATLSFRDKYFGLPGDITNATQFWGVAAVGAACAGTATTDGKTCDGDGNGVINTMSASFNSFEFRRAWQQLADAGLIEGQYEGVFSGPVSKLNSAQWVVLGDGLSSGAVNQFDDMKPGNSLILETVTMKPEEVWNIDTKVDDGKPAQGKVMVMISDGSGVATCTDVASPATLTGNYLLSSSTRACSIKFRRQF